MQEKKTLSKNKVKAHTFTGFSGAILSTSAGQGIQAITYNETNYPNSRTGTIIFSEDVPNGFWNFCINYVDEYENHIYIRLTAPKLIDSETGEELEPSINISREKTYAFKYSEIWKKTFDKDNNPILQEYR